METTINLNEVLRNSDTPVNQDIKRKFVEREVYCNVNSLVGYCLNAGFEDRDAPFTIDDIENYYSYPEYYGKYAKFSGGTEDDRDEEIKRLEEIRDSEDENITPYVQELIDNEIEALQNLESEPQEIYEWWAISSFLYADLKRLGEPVADAGSCYVWGRTTTGQAILLDGVISRICAEMGILDGQEHSWKELK